MSGDDADVAKITGSLVARYAPLLGMTAKRTGGGGPEARPTEETSRRELLRLREITF